MLATEDLAGTGTVDLISALRAGNYLSWRIIGFDDCTTHILDAVAASACWLVGNGLSSDRLQEDYADV